MPTFHLRFLATLARGLTFVSLLALGSCLWPGTSRGDFVVDGVNNFAAANTYPTSDSSYTGYLAANATNLHFGYNGPDIQTGGASHFIVAYVGAVGPGTSTGINFNTQQPNLSFAATHALVYRADGGYTQFFDYNGASWTAAASSTVVAESGQFFEAGMSLVDLGLPSGNIHFAAYLLFEGSGFESSFAAMPSTAFNNGTYDPNLNSHFTLAVPEPTFHWLCGAIMIGSLISRRRSR